MFSIFTHFIKPVRDTNNEPVLPVMKTLFCPLSLYVFSCINSTYLLRSEERRERERGERQRARINRPRASEEESCGEFMQHLETCLLIAEADRVLCHLIFKPSFCTASPKWNRAAIKILLLFLAGIFSYPIDCTKEVWSDILASSSSWKIANTANLD